MRPSLATRPQPLVILFLFAFGALAEIFRFGGGISGLTRRLAPVVSRRFVSAQRVGGHTPSSRVPSAALDYSGARVASSGTYMAAPHVSGGVAPLLSQDANLGATQARSMVLPSAQPLPGLTGLLLTGTMVNATLLLRTHSAAGAVGLRT